MQRIPTLFFIVGAAFALVGMVWGIQMAASQDHSLSPAHGHLNLIGFVAMSVFGTYYALTPQAAATKLATVHFYLTVIAVLVIVPGIAMAITETGEALAATGSVLSLLSMAVFVYVVARNGVGSADPSSPRTTEHIASPAE